MRGRDVSSLGVMALAIALPLLAPTPVWAQASRTAGPEDPAEVAAFLDEFMTREMERLDVPGAAITVVRDGQVLLERGYGVSDLSTSAPVDPAATVFRIGSVSKPLTSLAVLQQSELGAIPLDRDIAPLVPLDLDDDRFGPVTPAALLTHTAGFAEQRIGIANRDASALPTLADHLADHVPARFAPTGVVHSYANFNYALLALLVERVSGEEFTDYMTQHVFTPLGMRSTTFAQTLPLQLVSRLATGYVGPLGERVETPWMFQRDYPAAGASTTAADMARFMIAVLDGHDDVVSPESTAAYRATAWQPDPTMPGRTTAGLEERWINGERAVTHGGDTFGYAAQLVLLPQRDTGYFLVTNVESDEFRERWIDAIFDRYYPDPAASPTPDYELARDELARFAGTYRWTRFARTRADKILAMTPTYNTFVTANDDGTLTLAWLDVDQTWTYRPTGPTTFTQVAGQPTVVDGLVLDPGQQIAFTVTDGDVRFLHTSLHTIALEKVPRWLVGVVQIAGYGIVVILFGFSLMVWPVGSAIRHGRGRPATHGAARATLWLTIGVGLCLLAGTGALFAGLSSDVVYGPTPLVLTATSLISVAAIAGLFLLPAAVGAWTRRWYSVGGRLYLSALAVVAPALLWWANYWNLLGLRF